jgi:hypothetical protein
MFYFVLDTQEVFPTSIKLYPTYSSFYLFLISLTEVYYHYHYYFMCSKSIILG